ncbi:MAG: PQQ-binding-like beta-propeller repeat protein, partial [Planctomycetota bacterium]
MRLRLSPQLLWGLLSLLATSLISAQEDAAGFLWHPTRAESLRDYADAVDQARSHGDSLGVRRGLTRIADEVVLGVPDGGLSITPELWLGPGAYLSEIRELLPDPVRFEVARAIEQVLRARLFPRGGEAEPNPELPPEQALRLIRDFPHSRLAKEAHPLVLDWLLEQGRLAAYLDLAPDPVPQYEVVESLRSWSRGSEPSPYRLPAGEPLDPKLELQWTIPGSAIPGSAISADPSPWIAGALEHPPLFRQGRAYLQGVDRVQCVDLELGQVLWTTPYPGDSRTPLPGSQLAPVSYRDLIIASHEEKLTAFTADTGEIRWELPVRTLFSEAPVLAEKDSAKNASPKEKDKEAAEIDAGMESREEEAVIAVTPPQACSGGVVVMAVLLKGESLVGRIALVDEHGSVLWNRPVGSAPGATYLALGAARPALDVHGDVAYLLTQRGFLCSFHLSDGALLWATRYPSFASRGSRDSLRFNDRIRNSGVQVRGAYLVGAPSDSAGLLIWNRASGEILAQIPRGEARWWGLAGRDPEQPLALASQTEVSLWTLESGKPLLAGVFQVPQGLPPLSGAPYSDGQSWWYPTAKGYFQVGLRGESWHYQPIKSRYSIEEVAACASTLVIGNPEHTTFCVPYAESAYAGDGWAARLLRARRMLGRRDISSLLTQLQTFSRKAVLEPQYRNSLLQLIEEILQLSASTASMAEAERAQLIAQALDLLPRDASFAQAAYNQAISAFRRGNRQLTVQLAYQALEAPPRSHVTVSQYFEVPVELAVRRLLQFLHNSEGELPELEPQEALAQEALERARLGGTAASFEEVALHYPGTPSGRRAVLELAREYFLNGLLDRSLLHLKLLALLEPETPESIEACLRIAELHRDERRYGEARAVLEDLQERYGQLIITTPRGAEKVITRTSRMLATLPQGSNTVANSVPSASGRLQTAWRTRTDLLYQRDIEVIPLNPVQSPLPEKDLFLVVASRRVELWDAFTGTVLWSASFPTLPSTDSSAQHELGWQERGRFRSPAGIHQGALLITDRERALFIDLRTGLARWEIQLPRIQDGEEERVNIIERAAVGDGCAIFTGLDDVTYCFDLTRGELIWQEHGDGALTGPPDIAGGKVVLGFPFHVVVRDLASGAQVYSFPLQSDEEKG